MLKRILGILMITMILSSMSMIMAAGDPKDRAGSKDPPLFSRMPGFYIFAYKETEFDRYEFPVENGKKTAVEGHNYEIGYHVGPGVQMPSPIPGLGMPPLPDRPRIRRLWYILKKEPNQFH